jgi:hypothetical protein
MKLVKLTTILPFIALLLTSAPSSAMVMYVEGTQLIVTGPLSGFELTQFSASLAPNITTVVLTNSSGGDFASGLNLASIIRQRGLATVAKGYCQSSCANAFLGGVRRYLADDLSSVAFRGQLAGHADPRTTRLYDRRQKKINAKYCRENFNLREMRDRRFCRLSLKNNLTRSLLSVYLFEDSAGTITISEQIVF